MYIFQNMFKTTNNTLITFLFTTEGLQIINVIIDDIYFVFKTSNHG